MIRTLILALAGTVLLFSLAACGGSADDPGDSPAAGPVIRSTPPPAAGDGDAPTAPDATRRSMTGDSRSDGAASKTGSCVGPDEIRQISEIREGETIEDSVSGGWDLYCFQAEKGLVYRIEAETGGVLSPQLEVTDQVGALEESRQLLAANDYGVFRPRSPGIYYLYISVETGDYSLSLTALTDDHPNYQEDATPIEDGQTLKGEIEYKGDRDVFSFQGEEGVGYRAEVSPDGAGGINVDLRFASGSPSLAVDWDDAKVWISRDTQTIYVFVSGWEKGYSLSLSSFQDDHADGRGTGEATEISPGQAVGGILEHESDIDVFRFQPADYTEYRIEGRPGTSQDVVIHLCTQDARNCTDEAQSAADAPAVLVAAFWPKNSKQTRYVKVSGPDSATGTYNLSLFSRPTNCPSDLDARRIEVGETKHGKADTMRSAGKIVERNHTFCFLAEEGQEYRIEVLPSRPDSTETIKDSVIVLLTDELEVILEEDDEGMDSLVWTAPSAVDYYITVRAKEGWSEYMSGGRLWVRDWKGGTYALSVTLEE